MSQEEAKKRLLRRITIGLFLLLILVLCVFQAPWKVLALLIIILASFTILPKPARKWFWPGVAGVVIALVIWVFLPDDAGNWRPYTFDEELAVLEAKRAIPDSENAAIIYYQLLEAYGPYSVKPDFLDDETHQLTMSQAWSGRDYPKLAQWLKQQQLILAGLIRASKKAGCRFPIVANTRQLSGRIEQHGRMRRWAYLLLRAGNNDIAEQRINEALEKYICVLQMAEHLYQQPTLVDWLVGIAIEELAIRQLNRFAVTNDVAEEHLSFIEQALTKNESDWGREIFEIIECEKLLFKNIRVGVIYEINSEGKVRFNRDPLAALRAQMSDEFLNQIPPPNYWRKKRSKARAILNWFRRPSTPQRAGKIIDASYVELYEMTNPEFNWEKPPARRRWTKLNYRGLTERMINIIRPGYYRLYELYVEAITYRKAARLIVALRRYRNQHNRWPEELEKLSPLTSSGNFVDPTNGGPFVYKLSEDEFRLYSKGRNNIDEGGRGSRGFEVYKKGPDDIPIWPRQTRETNREDPNDE